MIDFVKRRTAAIIGTDLIGALVRAIYRNRLPWYGGRLHVDPALVVSKTCALIRFGLYESAERRTISRHLRPGDKVVECGASIGGVSCVIHHAVGPRGRVALIEARSELLRLALSNVERNFPSAKPLSLCGAIDYSQPTAKTICFSTSGTNIDGRIDGRDADGEVPRFTLAEALDLLPGDWNVLVADIEGAEIGLVERDSAILRRFDRLILELHEATFVGRTYSVADVAARFLRDGAFEVCARDGNVYCFQRAQRSPYELADCRSAHHEN